MSILNVEKIQPVGSGTTVTVNSGYLETPSIKGSDANFTGIITATSFTGSGANLTSIPAGNLTGTVADARISTLTASKLTGALPAISGANLTGISAGGGKILQVVQEHRTDVWSEGSIAPGAKTGAALTKAITTTANNNKVLVTISLTTGWSDQTQRSGALLKRGGTEIALADSTGDNKTRLLVCGQVNSGQWMEPQAFTYLDSPGSAATHTYTVHLWNGGANDTLTAYLNRAGSETNHSYRSRGTSSITLMEVSP